MENNKAIIALFGISDTGKTTVLKLLINKLSKTNQVKFIKNKTDIIVTFEIKNIKVGIATGGDNEAVVRENINTLLGEKCSIIVTATRTKGRPVDVVPELANTHGYQINWIKKSERYKHEEMKVNADLVKYQEDKYNEVDIDILLTTILYYINNKIN